MRRILLIPLLMLLAASAAAQEYTWSTAEMDGSRTGCVAPARDNVKEALGYFKGGKYHAPNGSVHKAGSAAAKVARVVMDAQPEMARVKDVIAYSPVAMTVTYPESALSDWYVDIVRNKVAQLSGREVHIGVCNFGGIRVDMPEGNVILDDMLSMFPFKNYLVYVEHKGSTIRRMLEKMASGRFQVLSGVRVVAENGKLVSVEIAGEPLDDEMVYSVATISFLLDGGDGLALRKDSLDMIEFRDVDVIDAVLEYVYAETEAGRPLTYSTDGRVVIW